MNRRKFLGLTAPVLALATPSIVQAFPAPKTETALTFRHRWQQREADSTGRKTDGEWWTLTFDGTDSVHTVAEAYRTQRPVTQLFTWQESGVRYWTINCLGQFRDFHGGVGAAKRVAENFTVEVFQALIKSVSMIHPTNGLKEI